MEPCNRRVVLAAIGGLLVCAGVNAKDKVSILILCTGNSARSQMAEGILRAFDSRLNVYSAGTNPAVRVNPHAVRAMREIGIDIAGAQPKHVKQYLGQSFDYVVTVCDDADKNCPNFSGKVGKRLHIGFPDPAKATGSDEQVIAVFRKVRDGIRTEFQGLFESEIKPKLKG